MRQGHRRGRRPPATRPTKILIIEDDLSTREALALLLGFYEYDVTVAGDGQQALALLAGLTPDLILMDWRMPGLCGLPLCQALRRRWQMMPIVVLTSAEEVADGDHPVNAWLRKPIDPPLLNQVIRRELAGPGQLSHG